MHMHMHTACRACSAHAYRSRPCTADTSVVCDIHSEGGAVEDSDDVQLHDAERRRRHIDEVPSLTARGEFLQSTKDERNEKRRLVAEADARLAQKELEMSRPTSKDAAGGGRRALQAARSGEGDGLGPLEPGPALTDGDQPETENLRLDLGRAGAVSSSF